jgi:hypothetical protein
VEDQPSDQGAAARTSGRIRDDLINTALQTAQVMARIAASRERAAANYRRMASDGGPRRLSYLQHAAELEASAARARRFSDYELRQVATWREEDQARQVGA